MKKLFFVAVLSILFSQLSFAQWTGTGTQADPYQIKNPEDLVALSDKVAGGDTLSSKYFKLMNDIDMTNITFIPIGGWNADGITNNGQKVFMGTFDGDNNVIRNLTILKDSTKNENNDYVGLFGLIISDISTLSGGVIQNLGLENTNIKGYSCVGGLVGRAFMLSQVINCYTTGKVSGNQNVGGLIGYNDWGSFYNSFSTSNVNGDKWVGGFIGLNSKGSVKFCFATGNVFAKSYNGGGFTGINQEGAVSQYCYSTGNIKGGSYIGGFAGENHFSGILSCYSVGDVNGNPDIKYPNSIGGFCGESEDTTGSTLERGYYIEGAVKSNNGNSVGEIVPESEMKTQDFVNLLNDTTSSNKPWKLDFPKTINKGFPILSWATEEIGQISTPTIINDDTKLSIYPNPASSNLRLEVKGLTNNAFVTVLDLQGRIIHISKATPNNSININVSDFAKGIYFVRVYNSTFNKVEKLIVE